MTRVARWVPTVLALLMLVLPTGCASAGSEQKVGLMRVNIPLREPLWVPEKEVVLALSEDWRQVVRVDVGKAKPGSRAPVRSEELEGAGENLVLSHEKPELAYLPRPELGRISALNTDTLRVVGGYVVGDSPSYVTLDVQSEVLFALSEDGSTVSGLELETSREIPAVKVEGGPGTLVEAPEKGLDPAFWIVGPDGVAFYGGDPPERLVSRPIETTDIAVDLTSSQRAYVAEADHVVALEGDPEHFLEGKLETVATRSLGEKVEHVASDELHVFAATRSKLVAMRRETLETVEAVEFGRLFEREGISPQGVSGITVGTQHAYLTLEGEPYVLSVKKP